MLYRAGDVTVAQVAGRVVPPRTARDSAPTARANAEYPDLPASDHQPGQFERDFVALFVEQASPAQGAPLAARDARRRSSASARQQQSVEAPDQRRRVAASNRHAGISTTVTAGWLTSGSMNAVKTAQADRGKLRHLHYRHSTPITGLRNLIACVGPGSGA